MAIPGLPTTGLPTLPTIPGLPTAGSTDLAALGGVRATVGAVRALAQTKVGGAVLTPQSSVASVNLTIGSPALGGLLAQLKAVLDPSVLTGILSGLPSVPGITVPAGCALTSATPSNIYLDSTGGTATAANSAVTIDVADATIAINVGALVKDLLGKDISDLSTSNFDLIDFLVSNLPKILSSGLTNVVTGLVGADKNSGLQGEFTKCLGLLGPLGSTVSTITDALSAGEKALLAAIAGLSAQFTTAATGPLGQLADGLKNVADIGLNVQSGPGIQPHEKTYPFTTKLDATPDQATAVVKNQTLVRAVEVDVLSLSGLPAAGGTIPSLPSLPDGRYAEHGGCSCPCQRSSRPQRRAGRRRHADDVCADDNDAEHGHPDRRPCRCGREHRWQLARPADRAGPDRSAPGRWRRHRLPCPRGQVQPLTPT